MITTLGLLAIVYVMVTAFVFTYSMVSWVMAWSEDEASRAARGALTAWAWPVKLLALLREMREDAR